MLLSIDSGRITLHTCKLKDQIRLAQDLCEVEIINNKVGLQENNKYMFTLAYKVRGVLRSTTWRLTLGTDSECSRRDWAFTLQLATRWSSAQLPTKEEIKLSSSNNTEGLTKSQTKAF
jgi:hypothetical protein